MRFFVTAWPGYLNSRAQRFRDPPFVLAKDTLRIANCFIRAKMDRHAPQQGIGQRGLQERFLLRRSWLELTNCSDVLPKQRLEILCVERLDPQMAAQRRFE